MDLIQTEYAIVNELAGLEDGYALAISDHGPLTRQAINSLVKKGTLRELEEGWILDHSASTYSARNQETQYIRYSAA